MLRKYLIDLSLILVAIIWALNFSVVKVSLEEMDPYSFNALRFIFSSSLLWYAARRKGYSLRIKKEHFWQLVGIGIVGNMFYQLLFIIGINYTYAANAAVMLGTIPIWVALLSQFFTDEKLTLYKGLGVLFAFAGVTLIILGSSDKLSFESETFLGNIITLVAALCWAIYTILSRRYLKVYSPLQYSAFMSVIGLAGLLAVGLPFLVQLDWSGVSLLGYGGIFYSGALSVGLAYIMWNNGVKKIGAVRTAAYQNLVPVLGLLFGVILLGEELATLQYIGASLVIAGIILARKKTARELKVNFK
ncbi:Permease of the drug/metabolite transporter (DMT) superfamily [Gracilimonas mengyeensis]|uniref:Permease of the drug/metabolite transporter (DMT) superfamily n=1 Tax=Gracilimonas mengyeensis TaxID=1302730 RepID=A0A521DHS0_9BACT|nr:Permease of the drug/metabolite transporter (DMT) superfamily [Gracilimonas mengyeensis]